MGAEGLRSIFTLVLFFIEVNFFQYEKILFEFFLQVQHIFSLIVYVQLCSNSSFYCVVPANIHKSLLHQPLPMYLKKVNGSGKTDLHLVSPIKLMTVVHIMILSTCVYFFSLPCKVNRIFMLKLILSS